MLKRSRYALLFPSFDGHGVLYHALNGSITLFDPDAHQRVRAILWRPNYPYRSAAYKSTRVELRRLGCILPAEKDERAQAIRTHRAARRQQDDFSLTLAPTLDCNLRCIYCFEGTHPRIYWTPETEDAVFAFAEARLREGGHLGVHWFGGEPLLALDIVLRFSRRLMELAQRRQASWSCAMVTNGMLLTPETTSRLEAIECREFQVTLDGPREINDRLRRDRHGRSSFDTILGNLRALDLSRVAVRLRINIMAATAPRAMELVRLLAEEGFAGRMFVYLAAVDASTKACHGIGGECLSPSAFAEWHFESLLELDELGFASEWLPAPMQSYCGADRGNSFVVDARGDIFKCWNHVGLRDQRIGNVLEPDRIQPEAQSWADWDPFADTTCAECPILPSCVGGCPAAPRNSESNVRKCIHMKHKLADYLNFHVWKHLREPLGQ